MKKIITILLLVFALQCNAQLFNPWLIQGLSYNGNSPNTKQMFIRDSILYSIRAGGLEKLNLNDSSISYKFANIYSMKKIVPDTGSSHFVFFKGNNYIGRYNSVSQHYENIADISFQNETILDVDVSPDGNVWASTNSKKVFIYNGLSWVSYAYIPYLGYGFTDMKVINDTTAFLRGAGTHIIKFHNGTFDSLYTLSTNAFTDWDIDTTGNIWIAEYYNLINVNGTNITIYDTSNSPIGTDYFTTVKIGTNGQVWTTGIQNKLLDFNGTTWSTRTINNSGVNNFVLDSQNRPVVYTGISDPFFSTSEISIINNSNETDIPFPFMPINNIKAFANGAAATNEGLFTIIIPFNFRFGGFSDTSVYQYADDITCLTINPPTPYYGGYNTFGSHYGLRNLSGFDNALMGNDSVNYIYYNNGTYYIGTDSGLVIYNGTIYSYFNTSNSPLPSDKITFITISNHNNAGPNDLYIGTDKGFVIYRNSTWTIYDSTTTCAGNFYVTDILPYQQYFDTTTYVTTLGKGLLKLFTSGGCQLLNTSNGLLLDDSLYYVRDLMLGECPDIIIIGTQNHGIIDFSPWQTGFYYDTLLNGNIHFNNSMFEASTDNSGYLISCDKGLLLVSLCGGINEIITNHDSKNVNVYPIPASTTITFKQSIPSTNQQLIITNVLGEEVYHQPINNSNHTTIDISNWSNGVYFYQIRNEKETWRGKFVMEK